ncbi:polysaccharide biosynthesis/export family protein [Qipengyuania zhejiangensis]|uniref:polysaccharide biosynthesis/export family protein n=1 Tax=Qipengyuania zhejiangensis TaxID=3077782 RepID=UPI002D795113|nr:polysaccharide biosynthesis/export family protein [Qipengyuania sp. Z2]
MNFRMIGAALLLVVASACSNPTARLEPLPQVAMDAAGYELGAGDKIRIVVGGFDALSNDYNVSDVGTVSLPMLGSIAADGKTTSQLETHIAGLLESREIAVSPVVSVQIEAYRPFYILGEVKVPGAYPYVPGMTVLTAISIAGGHTFRADTKTYGINRTIRGQQTKGRGDADTQVMPGDTVIVNETWF